MKGIILAGGAGRRLYPLTRVTNKHLLPVGRVPMIIHPIRRLVESGIKNIMIITGIEHMGDMINLLGSGSEYGCEFTYRVQDSCSGVAGALSLCRNFVGDDGCVVHLGDNIFENPVAKYIQDFQTSEKGCMVLFKKVEDPRRFGVPTFIEGEIIEIEEKPENPKSNYANVGLYMYDSKVFDVIDSLSPSNRGEYEITDVNNSYILNNDSIYGVINGWWSDAGTFESLNNANNLSISEKNE